MDAPEHIVHEVNLVLCPGAHCLIALLFPAPNDLINQREITTNYCYKTCSNGSDQYIIIIELGQLLIK